MLRDLLVLIGCAVSGVATASGLLQPDDFAWGMPLELDGEAPLYRLTLPEAVHASLTRADLGDLRVFNAAGEVVPHLLRTPDLPEALPPQLALPWFALPASGSVDSGATAIRIQTDERGAVVDVQRQGDAVNGASPTRYLIDASALQQPIAALRLSWQESGENFLLPLSVEISDDLEHWRKLAGPFSIASLRQGDERLLHDTLELRGQQVRYLRISGSAPMPAGGLQGVHARLQGAEEEPERQWLLVAPSRTVAAIGEYDFEVTGHYPFDRMQLVLPQDNTTVVATLYSAVSDKEPGWRMRHHGVHYRLGEWHSGPAMLRGAAERYWRLQVDMQGGGLGQGEPQLRLGWVPRELLFVARGDGPFLLAYGASQAQPAHGDGVTRLQGLLGAEQAESMIKSASAAGRIELGGVARLQPPARIAWRSLLLWAVLLLGVALLAAMAWQLARQMKN